MYDSVDNKPDDNYAGCYQNPINNLFVLYICKFITKYRIATFTHSQNPEKPDI